MKQLRKKIIKPYFKTTTKNQSKIITINIQKVIIKELNRSCLTVKQSHWQIIPELSSRIGKTPKEFINFKPHAFGLHMQ